MQALRRWLEKLGWLRILLIVLALAMMVLRPEPGTRASYEGWELVPTLLTPTLAPLVLLGLVLDAMMAKVMTSGQPAAQDRARVIIWTNLALVLLLLLAWGPYFVALTS